MWTCGATSGYLWGGLPHGLSLLGALIPYPFISGLPSPHQERPSILPPFLPPTAHLSTDLAITDKPPTSNTTPASYTALLRFAIVIYITVSSDPIREHTFTSVSLRRSANQFSHCAHRRLQPREPNQPRRSPLLTIRYLETQRNFLLLSQQLHY